MDARFKLNTPRGSWSENLEGVVSTGISTVLAIIIGTDRDTISEKSREKREGEASIAEDVETGMIPKWWGLMLKKSEARSEFLFLVTATLTSPLLHLDADCNWQAGGTEKHGSHQGSSGSLHRTSKNGIQRSSILYLVTQSLDSIFSNTISRFYI